MTLQFVTHSFEELKNHQVYSILRLRSEVFVLEQKCLYQDIDGRDESALHHFAYKEGNMIAYARIFAPGVYRAEAVIGRVAVSPDFRRMGYGKVLMQSAMEFCRVNYKSSDIVISAQCYLEKFYMSLGFIPEGATYLEDDIPHIKMRASAV